MERKNKIEMITKKKFDRVIQLFKKMEGFRDKLYPIAYKLLDNNFEIAAYILILSTWNFARFQYKMRHFDLDNFKNLMVSLEDNIKNLDELNFENAEFDNIEKDINEVYTPLSEIEGIEYTGASKIMHLKNPKLFVMWDSYIRENYEIETKDYKGYIQFLKKMQIDFKNIAIGCKNKAKLIDEYNYISISRLQILKDNIKEIEKKLKKQDISEKKKERLANQLSELKGEKEKIENALIN